MTDVEVEKSRHGFDSLLHTLGFGRWTLFMFATYLWWAFMIPYFSMGGAFYNPQVDYWCEVEELRNSSWTKEQIMNYSIPWEYRGGRRERSRCTVYERDYTSVSELNWNQNFYVSVEMGSKLPVRQCEKWDYDRTLFQDTVSMEWNLVCGNAGWSPFFQSFYFIGTTFGEPLIGYLGDKFGRRTVLRGSSVLFTTVALASALVPYYSLVLAGRFILGILHASTGVAYVYAMEACPPKYRTISGLFLTAPFALTGIMFGVLAYFIRSWRYLQLVCASLTAFALFYIPFMDESPRWQILQGKTKEAMKNLKKAGRWHNTVITDKQILKVIKEEQNNAKEENENMYKHPHSQDTYSGPRKTYMNVITNWIKESFTLFRTPVLRRITLAMFVCWFSTGLTYWGMSLSGTTFSSNPFLYMILSSLAEIPGYSGFVPFVSRFGRKKVLAVNFAVCSASILAILFVPEGRSWIVFSLALVGKLFITGSYNLLYLFSSELFPTCVRARGLNVSSMMARIGSIVSPFIIEILASTYWWAPSVAFGCAAAFGSIGALLLPESKGKPLSETVEQVELLYGKGSPSESTMSISSSSTKDDEEKMVKSTEKIHSSSFFTGRL